MTEGLEVRIPQEIKHYKEKLLFGFSLRQSISIFIVLIINVPLYLFGSQFISSNIMSWLIIVIAVPIILAGFIKINNMHFEKFIVVLIKFNINPQRRKKNKKVKFTIDG